MDSFELNKIAGAVLGAILLILVIDQAGNLLVHPKMLEKSVLNIDTGDDATAKTSGEKEVTKSLAEWLAGGDAKAGAKVAKKCASCHTFDKGGKNKVGPNLFGTPGRDIAKGGDFSYSSALSGIGGSWSYEQLDAFLTSPKKFAKGTKMSFKGLSKPQDRADLIAYLRENAENPPALPAK